MGAETMEHYNTMVLIGGCRDEKVRGLAAENGYKAWHYSPTYQGDESNHYDGPIPAEDVRRRLLNWEIVEVPLSFSSLLIMGDNPVEINIDDPTRKILVRSDTHDVLHVVGSDYHTPDYGRDVIDFGEQIVSDSDGQLYIASAGLLKNGGQFWTQFMCPEVRVASGMVFQPFVTIADSCAGKHWEIIRGATAVVCDNTLSLALSQRVNHAKVRHTKNAPARYQEAATVVGLITEFGEMIGKRIDILANTPVSDSEWEKFLTVHFGEPGESKRSQTVNAKNREALTDLYTSDPMVSPWKGTALGVVQSVNTTRKHHAKNVGRGSDTRPQDRFYTDTLNGTFEEIDSRTIAEINSVFKAGKRKQLVFA